MKETNRVIVRVLDRSEAVLEEKEKGDSGDTS